MRTLVLAAWAALLIVSVARADVIITDGVDRMNVDTTGNADIDLPDTASQAGYHRWLAGTSDRGPDVRGTGIQRFLTSTDRILFFDPAESATINGNLWGGAASVMTIGVTVFRNVLLNAGNAVSANNVARITSNATFPYMTEGVLVARWAFRFNASAATNTATTVYPVQGYGAEMGFAAMTGVTTPTDGAYFKRMPDGQFYAATSFASAEIRSAPLTMPAAGVWAIGMIVKRGRSIDYFLNDVLVATLDASPRADAVQSLEHVPLGHRIFVGPTTTLTGMQLEIGQTIVYGEMPAPDDYPTQLATFGRKSISAPLTAYGQTANFTNSTNPTDRTLTNTTAAGEVTLGGNLDFVATLVAETDYIAFSYTVPTGFQLWVTGVSCDALNLGAANNSTGVRFGLFLAVNSSAVGLGSSDAAGPPWTVWGPRKIALGNIVFSPTAAIGAPPIYPTDGPITQAFQPPLVVESGRFFQIALHAHNANTGNTAAQVIRMSCRIDGVYH